MHRRSSTQSSLPISSLHPTLQGALESLDIDLEEELTRYRRQRQIGRYAKPTYGQHRHEPQEQTAAMLGAIDHHDAVTPAQATDAPASSFRPIPPPTWRAANAQPATESAPLSVTPAATALSRATVLQSQLTPIPAGATEELTNPDEFDQPDDYLASSEELLRGLAEDEKELRPEREPALLETLLTPLGIGSMLLLLLSSITLGYIIMNPSSLNFLKLDTLLGEPAATPASQGGATNPAQDTDSGAIPNSPNLANEEFVNLDLSTLGTLPTDQPSAAGSVPSTANPSATANPAAAPSAPQPPTAATQSDLPSVPIPRSVSNPRVSSARPSAPPAVAAPAVESAPPARSVPPRSTVAPAVRQPAPAVRQSAAAVRQPAPAPSVAAASTAPSPRSESAAASANSAPAQDYYYVVTDYSGDRSLETVREAVPDAYVRNFSNRARVQSGAFNSEAGAEALVEELAEQGISAEIYHSESE